jgi:O-antigen/teichoic acid export membrane protein
MNLLHRSIFFSAVERYGSLLFFVVSTAILSRLLTPAEFGLYALVNAITAIIAASFQEFGGANYLIQKPTLSEQNIRTAFTATLFLSIAIAAIFFGFRDFAAWFFSEKGLRSGLAVASLNFILSPFIMTISALLRRDMAFGTLARCNLIGNFITAVVSIALAAFGYSFMAPVWGTVAGNAAVVALLIVNCRDLRIFVPSVAGCRDVIGFGTYSTATIIINVFYNMAPQLILGRILDFSAVGLYSRAANVTQVFERLVTQVVNPVILPAIVTHTRTGGDLKRIYLHAAGLIAVVQWPFLVFFALMADPIIRLWLGPTWAEIVPLIQMLCIGSVSLFAACLTYPVLVAAGQVRDTLVSSLISLPPSLLVVFISSFFGVQAVAASSLLIFPFQAFVATYFISRHLRIRPIDLVHATLKSGEVTASSTACVLVSIIIAKQAGAGPMVAVLLASIFATLGWCIGLIITNHPLLLQMRLAAGGLAVPGLKWPFSTSERAVPNRELV